jgi:hypothetical protein
LNEALLDSFRSGDAPDRDDYRGLLAYFAGGWLRGRSALGARVSYPGYPSCRGRVCDLLEGFARMAPLLGAWVEGGRGTALPLPDGRTLDVADAFRRGMLAGTDPASSEYWGVIGDHDQRAVESADLALALWFFRDDVWRDLRDAERSQIASWLSQVERVRMPDNNWHLFAVLVSVVLHRLRCPADLAGARRHYERVKEFYLGDGWFKDGERGRVDYYNAWGFHYALHWLDQIDPGWDPAFIRGAAAEFLEVYRFLIGPEGFPVMGRSVCYRMAAPAPLVAGHGSHPGIVSAGEARRALDATWTHFIRRGALRRGTATQGYYRADPRILDNYSGPASCLWSLRSLIVAFALPDGAPFWTAAPEPLPVERADYRVTVPATGWTIVGRHADRSITLEIPQAEAHPSALEPYGVRRRLASLLAREPRRPENEHAKYGQPAYSSALPFCVPGR